jgi:uncharacterized protein YjiS (DUF1127 family)
MTITFDNWAIARTRPAPATMVITWLETGVRAWSSLRNRRRRARANYRALGAVSNATLKDIGLHRSEIMSLTLGDASGRRRHMGCR